MGKNFPKEYYCGNCQKKYSKKQSWEEHFEKKSSKCYHTKGPRIWAHNLELAREKYKHAKKVECTFKIKEDTVASSSMSDSPPPIKS